MRILDAFGGPVRGGDRIERSVLLGPGTGAASLSAVVVRVPAGHEFPLHTHPGCEDCFFVLAGDGEAFGPDRRMPLDPLSGVWVPAGAPHGLRAGRSGMLEIGFQSPADPGAVPFAGQPSRAAPGGLLAASLADALAPPGAWRPVFPDDRGWRHLDAHHASLAGRQEIVVEAAGGEAAVVVVRGAMVTSERGARLAAPSVLGLDAGERVAMRALEEGTLLLAVHGRADGRRD